MNFKSILAILILVGDLFVLIWLISFAGFINFSKFSISYLVGCFVIALIWGLFGFLDEKRLEKSFKKNYFKVNYIKLIPLLFYIIIGILSLHWINHPYIIGLITAKFIITHFIFISPECIYVINYYLKSLVKVMSDLKFFRRILKSVK